MIFSPCVRTFTRYSALFTWFIEFSSYMTDLTLFAMRGILGLGPHSIGEILDYMNLTGCSGGGLAALLRKIKRDRT